MDNDQAQAVVDAPAPAPGSEADIIARLDARHNPQPAKPKKAQAATDEPQPAEVEEPETAQLDAAAAETEAADTETEGDGQGEPQPDLSAIKVPVTFKDEFGAEVTEDLPVDELRSGYMRQRDYTAKTQEVSKARAAIPLAVEQGVTEARNQYVQSLAQFHALVQQVAAPELQQVDWSKLAAENPAEYVRLSSRAQQVQNVLQTISQQHQAEQQKTAASQKQSIDQEVATSIETLKSTIPEFTHDKYQSILQGAVREYGRYGLTREEVAGITGAVPIIVLNDALAYRALKAKQPSVQNKIAQAPNPIRPGAAKTRADLDKARTEPIRQRLAKTGELEDAVALYAARKGRQ